MVPVLGFLNGSTKISWCLHTEAVWRHCSRLQNQARVFKMNYLGHIYKHTIWMKLINAPAQWNSFLSEFFSFCLIFVKCCSGVQENEKYFTNSAFFLNKYLNSVKAYSWMDFCLNWFGLLFCATVNLSFGFMSAWQKCVTTAFWSARSVRRGGDFFFIFFFKIWTFSMQKTQHFFKKACVRVCALNKFLCFEIIVTIGIIGSKPGV